MTCRSFWSTARSPGLCGACPKAEAGAPRFQGALPPARVRRRLSSRHLTRAARGSPDRAAGLSRWRAHDAAPPEADSDGTRASPSRQPRRHPLEAREVSLPAVGRALVVPLILGPDAGLLHADEDATLRRRQRPGDDGPQPAGRLLARGVPAVGEPLAGFDDQHLAVDHAVPVRQWRGAEAEPVADDGLEVVPHQPLLEQRALRKGAPDLLRRVRHLPLDDEGTRGGDWWGHWSILLRRSSRRSNRSRQKAP